MTETILDSRSIQFAGRTSFVLSIGGWTVNKLSQMEFIQTWIVIATGIFSIIYFAYKIWIARTEIIEINEKRVAEGKDPIKFFGNVFKRKGKNK